MTECGLQPQRGTGDKENQRQKQVIMGFGEENGGSTQSAAVQQEDPGADTTQNVDQKDNAETHYLEGAEGKFPIVAIGASAGGLQALRRLFDNMPADSGCAFVVVMHLSSEHESYLPEILQPHTEMEVQQVTETVALEKNCVYLIPPNANLDAIDTHLRLSELPPRGQGRAPIDHFFKTLPQAHDGGIIGILLSGTGSDGTLGLRKIREYNGLTIVQDPAEAEFTGMPQSAIAAAVVDSVLPLDDIPAVVMRFVTTRPQMVRRDETEATDKLTTQFLRSVFTVVRARMGRDFSHYKRTTMLRRILRRMQFNHIDKPEEYLELMQMRPEETKALADDLLITVTGFFRDPDVYEALEKQVVPALLADKGPEDTVRVWVAGCATGEEAYSLAILMIEATEGLGVAPSVQIFASDLHAESLAMAREGYYPGDIEQDIGAERLKRFFVRDNGCYRIRKKVRERIVFAPHNLLADPPFSRMDLISCRNLLIYLGRSLQSQVAALFHYALQEDGFLVLGTSENVGDADLFQVEDKKHSIYRRRTVPAPELRLPVFPLGALSIPEAMSQPEVHGGESIAYGALHQHIVEEYGPPSVLLSPGDNVVHSSAQAGRFLQHPGGLPTMNIFKLVREEMRVELHAALAKVRSEQCSIRTLPILIRSDGEAVAVELDLRPATQTDREGFILLLFHELPRDATGQERGAAEGSGKRREQGRDSGRIQELEEEKQLLERRLQDLIEGHEASEEEIRASNEELQSSNEELRSTLEELETSKEELQSTNEELQILNQENRHKVEELDQLSGDLQNLLVATDIATLFLDRHKKIVRFTPKIEKLFNIQTTDRGRALFDFTSHLGYEELGMDLEKVLDDLAIVEREVQDKAGSWYLARILPYRDLQDRIAGTVVTFIDITRLKEAEAEILQAKQKSEKIIDSLPVPLLVLTPELVVHSANAAFYEHFMIDSGQTLGQRIYELGNRQWDIPALYNLLEGLLPQEGDFTGFEVDHTFEALGRRIMLLDARRLEELDLILLGIHDITEQRIAEEHMREADRRKDDYLAMLGHELRNPLGAIRNAAEILRRIEPEDERMRRTLGVLHRQSRHMSSIIDGLLDVSRIGRGKIRLNLQPIDLRQVIEGVAEAGKPGIQSHGLDLQMELPAEPLWVMGDEVRLIQVLENILGNAVKFTEPPGTITVTAEESDGQAVVCLRDSGIGIDDELLATIFEPFQQASQDIARTSGGLGLGLSLAKGLITLHRGEIEARSDGSGKGTEFLIRLPLTAVAEVRSENDQPVEVAPLTILVVEDNEDAGLMLSELLESAGHTVTVVTSGPAALEALQHDGVNLVLCDLGLPGMSGLELAREIRAQQRLNTLPLIAVTGYSQQEDRDSALAAGFNEHLAKPVDLEVLTEKMRAML